jgi:hypothetical protein
MGDVWKGESRTGGVGVVGTGRPNLELKSRKDVGRAQKYVETQHDQ